MRLHLPQVQTLNRFLHLQWQLRLELILQIIKLSLVPCLQFLLRYVRLMRLLLQPPFPMLKEFLELEFLAQL